MYVINKHNQCIKVETGLQHNCEDFIQKLNIIYLASALAEAPPAEGAPWARLGAEEPRVAGLALALPRQEVAGAVARGARRARLERGCVILLNRLRE